LGLTYQRSAKRVLRANFVNSPASDYIVALAGNPNTGKSTVFNALTGLKQHTGNWPGKTVIQAYGNYRYKGKMITLVDLPGTYSLFTNSPEEEVARDFICFGEPDVTIVVVDATCLERNLNFVLQVMEITPKTIMCLNLIDEARRRNIHIDYKKLQDKLGVPVIPTAARNGEGLNQLKDTVNRLASGLICPNPRQLRYEDSIEKTIEELAAELIPTLQDRINKRWIALRLIEGDYSVIASIKKYLGSSTFKEEFEYGTDTPRMGCFK
jgi:Fe2+ transport system protein B